ncbi:aminoglycoside phosphotransferase family protein [Actinotalea subterranea]|uniref:aminoglycoside phosphotransferase family protein n=1 Tax=Actinotalea subterranea TaxID=2607497 RepID=UPI00165DEC1E|nr:aminoglycoside phosphotransferase family protein [Actinotalea subterranea]
MPRPSGPVHAPAGRDLVAHWSSAAFLARATAWVRSVLAARGEAVRGDLVAHRVRFWSAVLTVPTDHGTRWFKATNPGQAFEAPLLDRLGDLAPEHVVRPLAVDAAQGWLLLPDAGPTLRAHGCVTTEDWAALLEHAADLQAALAVHRPELLATGLPTLLPQDAPAYAAALVDDLARLSADDPQHVDTEEAAALTRGLGELDTDLAALVDLGVPASLQPNDLSLQNAFAPRDRPGPPRLIDVGDAFWSHPFAVLQVPTRMACGTWPEPPPRDDAVAARLRDAYLSRWPQVAPGDRPTVARAADRLASIHRCESWRRLLAHADPQRLGVPTPRLADRLADALLSR